MNIRLVDSHCHLDHIVAEHPDRIGWMIERGCAAVGWSFAHRIDTAADLRRYWASQVEAVEAARRQGLACAFLAGVHPRNIPGDLRPERVAGLLRPLLDHPLCRGVGEIGLETASQREKEILEAHLELAPELAQRGHVLGIHTPRSDKARVTREVLAVLGRYPAARPLILVDHCTPETAPWVLDAGYRVGMSLSPVKSSAGDVRAVLEARPDAAGRLLLNTDSGTRFYEDLARFARSPPVAAELAERMLRVEPTALFRL